jgi:hypothetical protein
MVLAPEHASLELLIRLRLLGNRNRLLSSAPRPFGVTATSLAHAHKSREQASQALPSQFECRCVQTEYRHWARLCAQLNA